MRVAIIIVCLFYIGFGGYNYLFTGINCFGCPNLHLVKSNVKFTDNKQGVPIVRAIPPGAPAANILPDMEDEDSNDSANRKNKILARCLYALTYSFILTYLLSSFRSSKPYYSLFSLKYITQRVLRI